MALLEVDDVVVRFGGVTAVNHASFHAEAGEVTLPVLVGTPSLDLPRGEAFDFHTEGGIGGAFDLLASGQRRAERRHMPERREKDRLVGGRGAFGQAEAPVGDVVPPAQLVTDVLVGADVLEAHRLVQAGAARVRQNDLREGRPEALLPQRRQQHPVEAAPDPAAALPAAHVDRHVHGPAVGRPLAVLAGIRVADRFTAAHLAKG